MARNDNWGILLLFLGDILSIIIDSDRYNAWDLLTQVLQVNFVRYPILLSNTNVVIEYDVYSCWVMYHSNVYVLHLYYDDASAMTCLM